MPSRQPVPWPRERAPGIRFARLVATVLLVLLVPAMTHAATTWSGAGADNNWGTGANWVGGVAPASGSDLIFPAGALRLTNVNNLVAATAINSIAFQASGYTISGNSIGISSAGGIDVAAGVTGTITISLAIALTVAQSWNVSDAGATLDASGVISGTKALTKTGAGTFRISGAASNTFTGALIVNGGTVLLAKTTAKNINNGALTITTGLVQSMASNEIPTKTVTITSAGLLDLNNFSDVIGALVMTGGGVTTGSGTLTLGGTMTANPSTATATIAGNLAFSANRTFTINDGIATDDVLITAVIGGAFTLTKGGAGTLTLTGSNTYSGTTAISAGQLVVTSNNGLGTIAGKTTIASAATLGFRGGLGYSTPETLSVKGSGVGAAGAIKNISEDNSFAGPIILTAASAVGSSTSGNTLTLTGTLANGGFLSTFTGAGNTVANGAISGTAGLTKSGTGVLTLAAANLYLGVTTVSAGTLRVTSTIGSATGTGAVTVSSGAVLDGANPGGVTGTSTIANGGNLTPGIAGAGTLKIGALVLNSTSRLNFELGATNDQVNVTGNMTADGVLNVAALTGFGAGTYTLVTYIGALTNNIISIGSVPAGPAYFIDVVTPGQVNLRVHPVVTSILRTGANPTNATAVTLAVTFSEAVTGVDVTDLVLTTTGMSGASVADVTGSGSIYTVTVNTGTGSGTIRLDLTDNNTILAGGNPLGGASAGDGSFNAGETYTVDTAPPSVTSSNRAGLDPTGTVSDDFTVTFSETVTGVDATDFVLTTTGVSGASVTGVTGSGSSYTVSFNTGTGSGTIRLDLVDDDSIRDPVGNPLGGAGAGNGGYTAGQFYTVDKGSPTVVLSSAATDPTHVSPIPVTITFSKIVTGLTASAVSVTNGTLGSFLGSGFVYTFDMTPVTDGPVTADLSAAVAIDAEGRGNLAATQFSRTFDSVAPTVLSSNRAGSSPTNASSVDFTVTLSEGVTGVDATDLVLTTTGTIAGSSLGGVSGSGSIRTVSVNSGTGSGTIRLDLVDDDSILDGAGNPLGSIGVGNGNYTSGQTYTIDKIAPTVAMSSAAADPTNVSPISVTVTFSESVTGFTAPDVTTSNGTVSNLAGSGAAYSFDLTPGASGVVSANIAAGVANDAGGNGNTAAPAFQRTFDTNSPTVLSVYSSVADGSFGLGFSIPILIDFSEPVTVIGTPQLTLNTSSAPNAVINYASGSGTSTLTFTYTVGAGHSSADLDYLSTSALAPNSGTIKDAAGNSADLTLPAPGSLGSLGDNNNIVIDSSVPSVTAVSSTTADGSYGAGSTILVTVTFSQAEAVTGTPQLTLNTSSAPNGVASYSSGSGTATLTFTYTVAAGQRSLDLEYLSAAALALNGGTIKKFGTGTNANLTLPEPGTSGSLGFSKAIIVDTAAPTIINVTSTTPDGTYGAGSAVDVTVNFSEAVTLAVAGLNVTLSTGAVVTIGPFGPAASARGVYTVGAGESSSDLNASSPLALASGATLRDAAGNNATLTIPAGQDLADLKAIVIQTVNSVSVGNGVFAFGTRPLNTWLAAQSSSLTNDGNTTETLVGKVSTFTAGGNTWSLSAASNGPDQIRAQWSTTSATGPWTDLSAYDTNFTIVGALAASATVSLYFRILTPASSFSLGPYASTLTVTAQ